MTEPLYHPPHFTPGDLLIPMDEASVKRTEDAISAYEAREQKRLTEENKPLLLAEKEINQREKSGAPDLEALRQKVREAIAPELAKGLKEGAFARNVEVCLREVRDTLLSKNVKYGDSALTPIRIFSKADAEEQLKVRIDDKLKRIQSASSDDEDTILDLIGYLVLLRIKQST